MSHQDTDRLTVLSRHLQDLRCALEWLLSTASLGDISFRRDCTWTPKALIFAAILWSWSDEKALTDRFVLARKIVAAMRFLPRLPATSYQAFIKLLLHWSSRLIDALAAALHQRMCSDLKDRFEVFGRPVFGVDGSRLELPRTHSNECGFAASSVIRGTSARARRKSRTRAARDRAARRKKAINPQMWLTVMFHVGTGLPWNWCKGPSDSSERRHLGQMLSGLPENALIVADAGFVGYEIWRAILDGKRQLLVRVGSNVRLLKGLGYHVRDKDGLVYLWPNREAVRNEPPLVLRLVVAQGGRYPVWLVTSVLDESELSDQQVVQIYAQRWGVELFYRHFKQSFERRKLQSHKAEHAGVEADWSLLGLWALLLHAQVKQADHEIEANRVSVARVLRAYRTMVREYKSDPDPGEALLEQLARAVIDVYKRQDKASRDYPRKKRHRITGKPKISQASRKQINAAQALRHQAV